VVCPGLADGVDDDIEQVNRTGFRGGLLA
jgi:hypothetical protein